MYNNAQQSFRTIVSGTISFFSVHPAGETRSTQIEQTLLIWWYRYRPARRLPRTCRTPWPCCPAWRTWTIPRPRSTSRLSAIWSPCPRGCCCCSGCTRRTIWPGRRRCPSSSSFDRRQPPKSEDKTTFEYSVYATATGSRREFPGMRLGDLNRTEETSVLEHLFSK